MKLQIPVSTLALLLTLVPPLTGCGDDETEVGAGGGTTTSATTGAGGGATGGYTIENCTTNIDDDVPAFYKTYFRCVDISMVNGDVAIKTNDLPPHLSAYYDASDSNYIDWDAASTNHQIPATIIEQNITVTIPSNPTAKGITIDSSLLDGTLMTSDEEFPAGPAGVALDSVAYFSGAAGMGMNIADEAATFDRYEAHHAMGTYHYHGQTPGPLEVLQLAGIIDDPTPGSASIEVYAVMCDGTIVLGCTELDGSAPNTNDMDAQGGHVHDVTDGTTVHFAGRYHTHVCPGAGGDFSPEIQYYTTCP